MAFSKANLSRIGPSPQAGGAVQGIFIYNEVGTAMSSIDDAGYFNSVGQAPGVGDGTLYANNIIIIISAGGLAIASVTNDGTDTNDVTIANISDISTIVAAE